MTEKPMNYLYTPQIILLLILLWYSPGTAQPANEPNTTIFIYQDNNNNGAKEPEEPYLEGFSLEVTGFDGQSIEFTETPSGVFKGYVPRRARVVVKGYGDEYFEGNSDGQAQASVFYAVPNGGDVSYYVPVSIGPNLDYTKQNVVLPCYEGGLPDDNSGPALIEFGYMDDGIIEKYGGTAPNPKVLAEVREIGSCWGVGIRPKANVLYTSAVLKRHVGLGPMGIGGIYQYDYNSATLSPYDLHNVPTTNGNTLNFGSIQREETDGRIAHDGSDDYTLTSMDQVATYDIDAFDKVGKVGIGDIEVSEDEKTLWLVNLFERSLVAVDVSEGQPNLNNVQSYSILDQQGLPGLDFPFIRNFNMGSQDPGGAEAFTDHNRIAWERDKYYSGGQTGQVTTSISNTMNDTVGTTEPSLYKSYRIGSDFSYNIPVPSNGC